MPPPVETFGDVVQDALAAPSQAAALPGAHGPGVLLHEKLATIPPGHPLRIAFASVPSDMRVGQALQILQDVSGTVCIHSNDSLMPATYTRA